MKRKIPLLSALIVIIFFGVALLTPFSVSAATESSTPPGTIYLAKSKPKPAPAKKKPKPKPAPKKTACNLTAGCDLIKTYINPFINFLSIAFGLIAVISIIIGGIQYSASQGDPQKSAQAKTRISNTMLAIFAYLFLYVLLQFLIPGGLFH